METTHQHTDGPWKVSSDPHEAGRLFVETETEKVICTLPKNSPENYSNAYLISMAPMLLDSLKRIADGQWPQSIAETEGTLAMRKVARDAINKTEGRSV